MADLCENWQQRSSGPQKAAGHVIKPLGGGAHTCSVEEVRGDPERLRQLGRQFVQNRLHGDNLRLFSIGERLFSFQLGTTALDYREDDSVTVEQIATPPELIEPTRKLIQKTGFDYCALDFRYNSRSTIPVFLEINSFPMFVRFNDVSENRLADAILEFLLS